MCVSVCLSVEEGEGGVLVGKCTPSWDAPGCCYHCQFALCLCVCVCACLSVSVYVCLCVWRWVLVGECTPSWGSPGCFITVGLPCVCGRGGGERKGVVGASG